MAYEIPNVELDYNVDSGPAIQDAIDNSKKAVFIPGRIATGQTLILPFKIGNHIKGHGPSGLIHPNHKLNGGGSSITWIGDKGAVVRAFGNRFTWDGVSIFGHRPQEDSRANIGFQLVRPEDQEEITGTGRGVFNNLTIQGCIVAMSLGRVMETSMCDVLTFEGLTQFEFCKVGFQVKNEMGMGFKFNRLFPREVETIFDFQHGGSLNVDQITVADNTARNLLRIGNTNRNGSAYRFGHVKIDAKNESIMLVNMRNPGEAYISFDQIQRSRRLSGQNERPLQFLIRGNTTLKINGHNGMNVNSIKALDPNPGNVIVLNGCRILPDNPIDLLTKDSQNPVTLILKSCYDINSRGIPDTMLSPD